MGRSLLCSACLAWKRDRGNKASAMNDAMRPCIIWIYLYRFNNMQYQKCPLTALPLVTKNGYQSNPNGSHSKRKGELWRQ